MSMPAYTVTTRKPIWNGKNMCLNQKLLDGLKQVVETASC